jgi:hypothetical protein
MVFGNILTVCAISRYFFPSWYNSMTSSSLVLFLELTDTWRQRITYQHNSLYSWHSLYCGMISRASFGIVLSIGAMLLFAIWPNIIPLQQHLAMAQTIPGVVRPPPSGPVPPPSGSVPTAIGGAIPANTTAAGAPANTTAAGAPANTTAAGE